MKNLGKILTTAFLFGIIAVAAIGTTASAQDSSGETEGQNTPPAFIQDGGPCPFGDPELMDEMRKEMEQNREALQAAVENGDYNTWYELMTENDRHPEIVDTITADNFGKLQEMHQAMENKDPETAKSIADELGIKPPFGNKGQFRKFTNHKMMNGESEGRWMRGPKGQGQGPKGQGQEDVQTQE